MKRKINLLILLAGAALQACFNNDDADLGKKDRENDQEIQEYITANNLSDRIQSTDKGLYYYKTLDSSQNRAPKTGEQVFVHYTGRLLRDTTSIFDDSKKRGRPLVFALNGGQLITGFNDGVAQMKEGEQAVLLIPSRLGYGSRPLQNIPAYSNLRFDVWLKEVYSEDEALRVFAKDTMKIDLTKLKIATADTNTTTKETTTTYYISTQPGTGEELADKEKVNIRFRGRFIDGTEFAKPGSTDLFTYDPNGKGQRRGYLAGINKMKVGEKRVIFIPSTHAYGNNGSAPDIQGRQAIPGYTPLVFEVERVIVQ